MLISFMSSRIHFTSKSLSTHSDRHVLFRAHILRFILHPSALLGLKYEDITKSSQIEWRAKYMLTFVI